MNPKYCLWLKTVELGILPGIKLYNNFKSSVLVGLSLSYWTTRLNLAAVLVFFILHNFVFMHQKTIAIPWMIAGAHQSLQSRPDFIQMVFPISSIIQSGSCLRSVEHWRSNSTLNIIAPSNKDISKISNEQIKVGLCNYCNPYSQFVFQQLYPLTRQIWLIPHHTQLHTFSGFFKINLTRQLQWC